MNLATLPDHFQIDLIAWSVVVIPFDQIRIVRSKYTQAQIAKAKESVASLARAPGL